MYSVLCEYIVYCVHVPCTLVVGEQLSLQLSSIGAKIVLSGLPGEVEKMQEIAQSVLRPENVQ